MYAFDIISVMRLSAEEYKQAIALAIADINAAREAETLRIMFDLRAAVVERLTTSGTDHRGVFFPAYTPSYAKYGREKLGYQSRYVDFTRQGRMLGSLAPTPIAKAAETIEYELRPRDRENQEKLNGQYAKRGNILTPSEEEIGWAREANQRRINKILVKHGIK